MVFMEKQTGKTTEVAKVESRRGPCLPYRDQRLPGHPTQPSKEGTSRSGKEGQAKAWTESPGLLQIRSAPPLGLLSRG